MAQLSFITTKKLSELLQKASSRGDLYASVADGKLAIGPDPMNPSSYIDLSTEELQSFYVSPTSPPPTTEPRRRKTGLYGLEFRGNTTDFTSQRDVLADGLRSLENFKPGTLDKLSRMKRRTRRIVARDPKDLFDKAHLAEKYHSPLFDGWFFGTNNSAAESNRWLKEAAEIAGLKWGTDISTTL